MTSLTAEITSQYPTLKVVHDNSSDFFRIFRENGKKFVPNQVEPFQLVVINPKVVPVVQLITYHGHLLSSERLAALPDHPMLNRFARDDFILCPGLDDDLDLSQLKLQDVFIESLNCRVFIRARSCQYAMSSLQKNSEANCHFCKLLEEKIRLRSVLEGNPNVPDGGKVQVLETSTSPLIQDKIRRFVQEKVDFYEKIKRRDLDLVDKIIRSGEVSVNKILGNIKREEGIEEELSVNGAASLVPERKAKNPPVKESPDPFVSKKVRKKVSSKCATPKTVDKSPPEAKCQESEVMRQCDICLFEHKKAYIFDKHVQTHHQRYDLNAPVSCPVCNVDFKTKYELNPHFQATHDSSKGCCVECLEIMDWQKLKRHLTYVHFILPKNKLCPNCGDAFKNSQDLEIHISVKHEKTAESSICDHCGKIFAHPKILAKHFQNQHVYNNKGIFKCPFCEKVFDKSHAWHKHLKIHSKHKPYKCRWCDYRSVNRFNVRLHMRKKHKEDANYGDIVKQGNYDFGTDKKLQIDAFKVE